MKSTNYGTTSYSVSAGLGQVIRNKQAAMDKMKPKHRENLILMIKPSNEAVCGNMVNILDEVLINAVPHYAFMDLTKEEKDFITQRTGIVL